jgi:two-component system cell cycle response regulator
MTMPFKILLADDSPTQAAFMKLGLRNRGYEVVVARDGIEAVEIAYRENPDLLVSDIIMPRLNGYQVCRLLKDDQGMRTMPIVLLTSLDARADVFWGMKSGADLYLTKVPDVGSLVEEVDRFVREQGLKSQERAAARVALGEAQATSEDIIGRVIQLLDKNLFESTVLSDMNDLVNVLEDYKKIMFSVLEILSRVIDFDLGIILLLEDERREYFIFRNSAISDAFVYEARGLMDDHLRNEGRIERFPEEILLENRNSSTLNIGEGVDASGAISSHQLRLLTSKGHPCGSIGLFSRKPSTFNEKNLTTFGIIVRQANIVIDYARLYERNKQLSITDGLTSLYNHRYFQEALKREFARSARHKSDLTLVILDIDFFKKINDTHGHQQGDVILTELARILKRAVRALDLVSRYGGEEFTILMPDASLNDAMRVAERLRRSVENHEFATRDQTMKVTVSMGVASVPHPLVCNPAQLINAADQALYAAKRNGRNRVEEAFRH